MLYNCSAKCFSYLESDIGDFNSLCSKITNHPQMRPLKVKEKTKQPKKQNKQKKMLKLDVWLKSTENKDKNLKPKTKTTFCCLL